jgi:acyl-CoA dehydrogenase
MSILAPWLALILVIAFVSYHRFSLAVFAAIGGSALVACALLVAWSLSVIAAAIVL